MKVTCCFLLDLYRNALEKPTSEFKDWALNETKSLIPFDSCVWGSGSWVDAQPRIHAVHLHKLDNEFIPSWLKHQHEDKLARLTPLNIAQTFNVDVAAEYSGTDIHKFHCKRFEMEHILGTAILDQDTQLLNTMSLYRSNPKKPFSEAERSLKEILFPHLIESVRANWLTNLPHMLSENQRSTFNSIAACDGLGILHVAMPSFMETCRTEWESWKGPTLPKEVIDVMKKGGLKYVGKNIVVSLCRLDDLLLIRARPIIAADKLSPRELEVAQHFAAGSDYKTIAQDLSISPATIKVHLNNIYIKLEINEKASLVAEIRRLTH